MSFFFPAEDGIRSRNVTGVQTCALPIFPLARLRALGDLAERAQPGERDRRHAPTGEHERDRKSVVEGKSGKSAAGRGGAKERRERARAAERRRRRGTTAPQ